MYHVFIIFIGYYEVDTEIVRETMRVVLPPITDLSVVGTYIARECQDLPTYMLTKVNSDGKLLHYLIIIFIHTLLY